MYNKTLVLQYRGNVCSAIKSCWVYISCIYWYCHSVLLILARIYILTGNVFHKSIIYGPFNSLDEKMKAVKMDTAGGGGLPYIIDGDARRNFQKQPLKVTILGVAPANFIP